MLEFLLIILNISCNLIIFLIRKAYFPVCHCFYYCNGYAIFSFMIKIKVYRKFSYKGSWKKFPLGGSSKEMLSEMERNWEVIPPMIRSPGWEYWCGDCKASNLVPITGHILDFVCGSSSHNIRSCNKTLNPVIWNAKAKSFFCVTIYYTELASWISSLQWHHFQVLVSKFKECAKTGQIDTVYLANSL